MRSLLSLIASAWVLCVIGARGFPARVTPSHFVLDSRGRYDRLAVPGLLFFKPSWCSKNIILPGSCCQVRNCVGVSILLWSYVVAHPDFMIRLHHFFTPL